MRPFSKFFRLLLIVGICAAGNSSFAQTKGTNEWGISYGYNNARAYSGGEQFDARGGLNVSVSADHYLSESWSLKAKLQYDMKGSDSSNADAEYKKDLMARTQYDLNYLSIPLLVSWHFGYHKIHYIDLGPYAAVLLNGKMTFNGSTKDAGAKGFDTGIYFAVGAKVPLKDNFKFFGEIRGVGSYIDFKKDAVGNGYRNSVMAIVVGFNF